MARVFPIITAVAELFESVGFNAYKEPVGSVDSPAAIVTLGPGQPDSSMGRDSDDMTVMADLFFTAGPQGIENMYDYLDGDGSKSLIRLFDENRDLGGVVDFAALTGWGKPDRAQMANGEFYHVEIAINIGARGLS